VTKELKVFLWVLIVGISLAVILKFLFPLMAPFLLGIVFACLIEPLVKKIDTCLKVSRKFAIILILAALVIIVFSITGLSLLTFYEEAQRLMPQVPGLVDRLLGFAQDNISHFSKYFPQLTEIGKNFTLSSE
jgi:predicted PurR-regulated permease PerM